MSSSDTSENSFLESSESALIESLEAQIDNMHDEIKNLNETIDKLNKKKKTFQSIIKSDVIGKIFKCL